MDRPVMNPNFFDEEPAQAAKLGLRLAHLIKTIARGICSLLLWRPFVLVSRQTDASPTWARILRGILYRLAVVPFILAGLVAAFVWHGSHPAAPPVASDPTSLGLHYDPITILSQDGVRLEGWIVPVLDARIVLEEKDRALNRTYGAVVLVHDQGMSPAQMLPLVRPLHNAGLVVLGIGMRGTGTFEPVGQTFGLREAADVNAAVQMLRRRQYIDPQHIGVLGVGSGATAALLSMENDPAIATVVLQNMPTDAESALRRIGPRSDWLAFLRPLCRRVFETAYEVDLSDLSLSVHADVLRSHPALILPAAGPLTTMDDARIQQISLFLSMQLHVPDPPLTKPLTPVIR